MHDAPCAMLRGQERSAALERALPRTHRVIVSSPQRGKGPLFDVPKGIALDVANDLAYADGYGEGPDSDPWVLRLLGQGNLAQEKITDEEILAQLTDSAERLGRSPTMREFAADTDPRAADSDADGFQGEVGEGAAAAIALDFRAGESCGARLRPALRGRALRGTSGRQELFRFNALTHNNIPAP